MRTPDLPQMVPIEAYSATPIVSPEVAEKTNLVADHLDLGGFEAVRTLAALNSVLRIAMPGLDGIPNISLHDARAVVFSDCKLTDKQKTIEAFDAWGIVPGTWELSPFNGVYLPVWSGSKDPEEKKQTPAPRDWYRAISDERSVQELSYLSMIARAMLDNGAELITLTLSDQQIDSILEAYMPQAGLHVAVHEELFSHVEASGAPHHGVVQLGKLFAPFGPIGTAGQYAAPIEYELYGEVATFNPDGSFGYDNVADDLTRGSSSLFDHFQNRLSALKSMGVTT